MTTIPEYQKSEEFQNRLNKLEQIKNLGVNPYPPKFDPTHSSKNLESDFSKDSIGNSASAQAGESPSVKVAGRLVLFRAMGKNAFAQLQDQSGRIQLMFNRDCSTVEGYSLENNPEDPPLSHIKFIEKKIDLGDIIGIEGNLFITKKGELTVFVKKMTLLCKTLLPLADKHSGLADKELRYRKRWLDLISNQDIKKTFLLRSQIMKLTRNFFEAQDFLEVETPILQSIYGGARARPFTTNLHALDQDMFLRISLEIPLKKLLVGEMNRIFEMGKVFRNEGVDRNHNPEFTLLEVYAAYWDYNDMMEAVENLFEKIALTLYGTTQIVYYTNPSEDPVTLELKAPWKRLSMKQSIIDYAKIDVDTLSDEEIKKILIDTEHFTEETLKKETRGLLIAHLFESKVEQHLVQPHHITDHPIETTPLCKPHRDEKERKNGIVERFESFILGNEICNAYTELNDPIIQRTLLEEQAQKMEEGDDEASPLDEEFLEAICQGMPPAGGLGIGMDRMIMLFTNSHSIRDVLFFPWMKDKEA